MAIKIHEDKVEKTFLRLSTVFDNALYGSSQHKILFGDTARIMGAKANVHIVVNIAPIGVMVLCLCLKGNTSHYRKGIFKVLEL